MSQSERAIFEKAIAADPYDITTRVVFADYLEEQGYDGEAVEQRRRATLDWCEAHRWMNEVAKEVDVSFEEMVQSGYTLIEHRHCMLGGDGEGFDMKNYEYEHPGTMGRFWRHWQALTGQSVSEEVQKSAGFTCCWGNYEPRP